MQALSNVKLKLAN